MNHQHIREGQRTIAIRLFATHRVVYTGPCRESVPIAPIRREPSEKPLLPAMSKVLVTGAAGFIGSHVIRALLERGDEVTGLVRKTSSLDRLKSLGIELAYGDVTDRASLAAAVPRRQTVYHLAGCTLALRAERYYQVNEQGVRNLAETCAAQDTPPVLVTVSSLAAAGPAPDDRLRTPDDPPAPVSHYGRSKRAGELAAEQFAARVPITIVRPPIVLGEADQYGLPMFRSIAWFGVHPVPGLGRRRYSVVHAADLARLLILAAERGSRLRPGREWRCRLRRATTSPPPTSIPATPNWDG